MTKSIRGSLVAAVFLTAAVCNAYAGDPNIKITDPIDDPTWHSGDDNNYSVTWSISSFPTKPQAYKIFIVDYFDESDVYMSLAYNPPDPTKPNYQTNFDAPAPGNYASEWCWLEV
jgi:hypothetical protein